MFTTPGAQIRPIRPVKMDSHWREFVSFVFPMKQFATVTVIGRDKPASSPALTNFLFEQQANIEALEGQVTRGQFSMTLQAS